MISFDILHTLYRYKMFSKRVKRIITRNLLYAYWYAKNIIKGRWPEAEPYLMQNPEYAYWYALHIIKDRWPEAEPYIKKDDYWWNLYKRIFNI